MKFLLLLFIWTTSSYGPPSITTGLRGANGTKLNPIPFDFNFFTQVKSCTHPSLTVGFTVLYALFPFSPSIHLSVCIFSSFCFNVCASHVLLYLYPPPPSGWCQCCCQAGVESSQSCGSLPRSSGVMLGSFMLIRWALPNVGHAPPPFSVSHSHTCAQTHTHTHTQPQTYRGVPTCTSACLTSPHMHPHGLSHRVGWCTKQWQHFQLFGDNWCSCSSQDALFIHRQLLPLRPSSHLLYEQLFDE